MDERELLVLGLLKSRNQHGYQINEFIETFLGTVTDMKKSTAYSILKKLHKQGYAEMFLHQEGNRPVRQVYSITPAGEQYFASLLRSNLEQMENMAVPGEIGLMFLDHLPLAEVIPLLSARLKKIAEIIQLHEKSPSHEGIGVDLSIDYRLTLLHTIKTWLSKTIVDLQEKNKHE
jgi:DNA-binding PadR family transcriptional regulator